MLNKIMKIILLAMVLTAATTLIAQVDQTIVKDSTTQSKNPTKPLKNITIPAGTKFNIVISSQLATNRNVAGSTFSAAMATDFVFNGDTISPKSSQVIGKIVESKSGQGLGDAKLSFQITEITVNHQLTAVVTDPIVINGERKRNAQVEVASGTQEIISLKSPLVIK